MLMLRNGRLYIQLGIYVWFKKQPKKVEIIH